MGLCLLGHSAVMVDAENAISTSVDKLRNCVLMAVWGVFASLV